MGSTPIIGTLENTDLLGNSLGIYDFVDRERSRKKARENTAYPSSICQVRH
jgi:hypothetical protein